MVRLIKSRSKKVGLPPGTLVHIGQGSTNPIEIDCFVCSPSHIQEKLFKKSDDFFASEFFTSPISTDDTQLLWIDVEGVHDIALIKRLGDRFGIHDLVLEDIVNTDQRPKIEDFGDYIYVVLKMLRYDDQKKGIQAEQLSLVFGRGFLISFQEGHEGDVFESLRERLRSAKGHLRILKTDYLAYNMIDMIVDHYFHILEKVGERVEKVEEVIIQNPEPTAMSEIQGLKREMIALRRSVWPLREILGGLERIDSTLIHEKTLLYFRDVYDHTIQVMDAVETYRDIISGMIDIYLSSQSNRQNEVMRLLTVFATLFMPLTFIVGIYGMNFDFMPEIHLKWGYPAVWVVMIVLSVGMLAFFKRKKWW